MAKPSKPALHSDETLAFDEIGPYSFIQKEYGHKLTSDTVSLADFVLPLKESDRVIDLGTGTGALALIFCMRSDCKAIVGVEILSDEAELAMRNAANNALDDRIRIVQSDFRTYATAHERWNFDVVVSNPPYRKEGAGMVAANVNRTAARFEGRTTLKDVIDAARRLVSNKGRVSFVYPTERVFEMIRELSRAGLVITRLRFIRKDKRRKAKVFLVEARIVNAGEMVIDEAGQ